MTTTQPAREQIARLAELLIQLADKEDGVGMSYEAPTWKGIGGERLNLYGRRAHAAYRLLSEGRAFADALRPSAPASVAGSGEADRERIVAGLRGWIASTPDVDLSSRMISDAADFIIGQPQSGELPDDVRRLVIAAREVCYEDRPTGELDAAVEAFASRVPWDDEPVGDQPQSGGEGV